MERIYILSFLVIWLGESSGRFRDQSRYSRTKGIIVPGVIIIILSFKHNSDGNVEWSMEGGGVDCRYKMPQFYKIKVYGVKFQGSEIHEKNKKWDLKIQNEKKKF